MSVGWKTVQFTWVFQTIIYFNNTDDKQLYYIHYYQYIHVYLTYEHFVKANTRPEGKTYNRELNQGKKMNTIQESDRRTAASLKQISFDQNHSGGGLTCIPTYRGLSKQV